MRKLLIIVAIIATVFYFYHYHYTYSDGNVLFISNDCPPCNEAIKLLDEQKIEYTEYNINDSDENYDLFKKYRGGKLPLVIIGDERIEGYDESLLKIAVKRLYEADNNKVEIFTRPGCGWCTKSIEFFQNNDIKFVEYDISRSKDDYERFTDLGGRGTPLILIGDSHIHGFNEKAIRMALEQAGLM